jgi:hypothetical protein
MRAAGTVPLPRFVAFSAVRFTPETAGKVAGKRASRSVPAFRSLADRVARSASDAEDLSTLAQVTVLVPLMVIVSGMSASTPARKVGVAAAPARACWRSVWRALRQAFHCW